MPTAAPKAVSASAPTRARPRATWLAVAVLSLATLVAYHNSFRGPFVFDDLPAIRDNTTIRELSTAFLPPAAEGNTVGGRPLLNLSFALNYAFGGLAVTGYHVANLLIHLTAGLLLFGLARRLAEGGNPGGARPPGGPLQRAPADAIPPPVGRHPPVDATLFAFAVALIWLVHPLQTESVTYIVQRAESLAGCFVLLALYAFVRAAESRSDGTSLRWSILSATACNLGVATKETVAVAPLLVLLVDRAWFAGGFAAALRTRRWFYLALSFSWLLAAVLVIGAGGRGGSAGFATPISVWTYALTQCQAIVHYLRLAVWPTPLVFDYGSPVVTSFAVAAPYALTLATLFVATLWALLSHPRAGTLAVSFFLLLAPSSSLVPIATQTLAEHRLYLPLAAFAALIAATLQRLAGRAGLAILAALAVPLILATTQRNLDYRSAEALWADTVTTRPDNPRAHNNLGLLLATDGRIDEAITHFEEAVRLFSDNPEALNNLGLVLMRAGRLPEAVSRFEASLQLAPESAETHLNLADALVRAGRPAEALVHFEHGARLRPLDPEALANYGAALLQRGRPADAIHVLDAAIAQTPRHARAHYNLGNALVALRRIPEAVEHYRAAVREEPGYLAAQANLGNALMLTGHYAEAAQAFEAASRLRPDDARLRAAATQARTLSASAPPR